MKCSLVLVIKGKGSVLSKATVLHSDILGLWSVEMRVLLTVSMFFLEPCCNVYNGDDVTGTLLAKWIKNYVLIHAV